MKQHIKFPKIGEYRKIIKKINQATNLIGVDVKGSPVYDKHQERAKLTFQGTVKVHGHNAGINYNSDTGLYSQSRDYILEDPTILSKFGEFVLEREDSFKSVIFHLSESLDINLEANILTVFGEWAGAEIKPKVGISNLEKAFYVFAVKVSPMGDVEKGFWVDISELGELPEKVYKITEFPTFKIEIDFKNPKKVERLLAEKSKEVEKGCPVCKYFGIEKGLGEGIVWNTTYKGEIFRFKVKTQAHSVSNVKELAPANPEKLASIEAFVAYTVTENRMTQAFDFIKQSKNKVTSKHLNPVVGWMMKDIYLEETDTLQENNLTKKDVNQALFEAIRAMFLSKV